ncbi:uncharacterized protein FYW49_020269 [Xenentodon cancila]
MCKHCQPNHDVHNASGHSPIGKVVEEHASRWQVPLPQLRILEKALCYFARASTVFASNCDHVQHTISSLALSLFELLLFFDQKDFDQDPLKHFTATFQECHLVLAKYQNVHVLQVERLVQSGGPWASPTLQAVLGESCLPQTEVDGYIGSELPVFFELRVRYLLSCDRVREAVALAKCCTQHPATGQHLFFLQVYLTWLHKTSQFDHLRKEVVDINGKDAVQIICSLECEEEDDLLLSLSTAFLSQQLRRGDMYHLCDLVFVWANLHHRLNTSKQALLKECHQLMWSATNIKSIFPFIRAMLQEVGEEGIQFCVELCADALKSRLPCDAITKTFIYKTIAGLLPNDLEVCRACALLVFFLERTVESYKMVYLLYMHPDQEYHVDDSPIANHVRFETLQILKKDLHFDPEFWNLITLRTSCLNLMSGKVVSAALLEIMEDKWLAKYCAKEPASRSSTSVCHGGEGGEPREEPAVEMKVTIASQSSVLDQVSKGPPVEDVSLTSTPAKMEPFNDNRSRSVDANVSNSEAAGYISSHCQDFEVSAGEQELHTRSSQGDDGRDSNGVSTLDTTEVSHVMRKNDSNLERNTTLHEQFEPEAYENPTNQARVSDISALTLVTEMVTELSPKQLAEDQETDKWQAPGNKGSGESRGESKSESPSKAPTYARSVPEQKPSVVNIHKIKEEDLSQDTYSDTSENGEPTEAVPETEESRLEYCCTFCTKVFKGSRVVAHAMFHYRRDECMFCGMMFKDDLLAMIHLSDHIEKLKRSKEDPAGKKPQENGLLDTKDTSAKAKTMSSQCLRRKGRPKKSAVCPKSETSQDLAPPESRTLRSNDRQTSASKSKKNKLMKKVDKKSVKEKRLSKNQNKASGLKKVAKWKSEVQQRGPGKGEAVLPESTPDEENQEKILDSSCPSRPAEVLSETRLSTAPKDDEHKVNKMEKSKKSSGSKTSDVGKATAKRKAVNKDDTKRSVKKKCKDRSHQSTPKSRKAGGESAAGAEGRTPEPSPCGSAETVNGQASSEDVKFTLCKETLAEYGKKPYMRLPPTAYLDEKYITMPKRRKDMSFFQLPQEGTYPEQSGVAAALQRQRCANCFATFNYTEELQTHLRRQNCSKLFGFDSDDEGNS